jgi:hypothetical protein
MQILNVDWGCALIGHDLLSDERATNSTSLELLALVGHCSKPKQKKQSLLRVIDNLGCNATSIHDVYEARCVAAERGIAARSLGRHIKEHAPLKITLKSDCTASFACK